MTSNRSLYHVLGVARDATLEQIRAAYRAKARVLHPDNLETGDREAFHELLRAHEALSDAKSRAYYDETGRIDSAEDRALTARAVHVVTLFVERLADAPDHVFAEDLTSIFIGQCGQEIQRLANEVGRTTRGIANLTKFKSKLNRSADAFGEDVMTMAASGKIDALRQEALQIGKEIQVLERAIEIASHYRFTPDAPPPSTVVGWHSIITVRASTLSSTNW